jgi:hypothetical protein
MHPVLFRCVVLFVWIAMVAVTAAAFRVRGD